MGLGDHACARAKKLAAAGYATLACDLHGDGATISFEEVMGVLIPLFEEPQRIRTRVVAALASLVAHKDVDASQVAAIGYCFGGAMALELGRSGADIAATVGFHCHLATSIPAEKGMVKGKVLVCVGADDPTITAANRAAFEDEMTSADVDWQMNIYGGVT